MTRSFPPTFVWHIRRGADRLGTLGILGLVLIVLGIGFQLFAVLPEKKQIDIARKKAETIRMDIQSLQLEASKAIAPADQLSTFYSALPNAKTAPDLLKKIVETAKLHNLLLEQGEYRLTRDADGKVLRYAITLPVKGDYIQMRRFIRQVLATVPSTSLDSIAFQRPTVADASIEAQIKLIMFLGDGA
ncbi:hypothetical protein BH11PSE12_BH11PSE12_32800 [soil metagenome]